MQMKNIYLILTGLMIVLVTSCSDDDNSVNQPSGLIYTYYPAAVGDSLIYDAELITKDAFTGAQDTQIYQLLEVVESIFTDNQNRPTLRLERYTRLTPADPWLISDVWTSNMTSSWVERKEENVIYVKLAFPITPSMTWNGNVLNTMDPLTYRYEDLHQPMVLGSLSFDSTLTVLQRDEDYFTERYYFVEKYANHVGMIYRENIEIIKDNTIPGQTGIKSQRKYKETLISYTQ
jgi:hypothetical protein